MLEFIRTARRTRFTRFALWVLVLQSAYLAVALTIDFFTSKSMLWTFLDGHPGSLLLDSFLAISAASLLINWFAATFERDRKWIVLPIAAASIVLVPAALILAFFFVLFRVISP